MKFAINSNGLRIAGFPAVIAHVQAQQPGDISIDTIKQWTDAERSALGVFRIVEIRQSRDELMREGPSTLEQNGDVADLTITAVDNELAPAKERMRTLLERQLATALYAGTTIFARPVRTDQNAINLYNTLQNAFDTGVAFPAEGVPIILLDGTKIKVNQANWTTLFQGVAQHQLACFARWDALDDDIDAATNISMLRTMLNNYQTGWPLNPSFLGDSSNAQPL